MPHSLEQDCFCTAAQTIRCDRRTAAAIGHLVSELELPLELAERVERTMVLQSQVDAWRLCWWGGGMLERPFDPCVGGGRRSMGRDGEGSLLGGF